MKQIQSVSIWYNGIMVLATIFNMNNNNNLTSTATFYWQLFTSENIQVADGVLTMSGFDYEAYTTSPDSNSYAYQWGATQLNLNLV
jgi:hypothetical protein